MEPQSSLPAEILKVLARGGTILTGNQRAARTLRLAYDRDLRNSGRPSWQPPAILPWETWTSTLWHQLLLEGAATRLLLNSTQELHVWRSIIAADSAHSSLRSVDSLAAMASGAWQLLCAYRGQSRLRDLGVSEDTRTFQRWAQSFNFRSKSDAYLSPSELENAIMLTREKLPTGEVLLIGFDRMTPAQSALLAALSDAGAVVKELPASPIADRKLLAAAETPELELTEAAIRVREFLEAHPTARVAVIHPDIASERGEIDRAFRQILAPELDSIAAHADGPYEFSLGQRLAQAPMVASAISILRLATGPLSIGDLSRLLLSPWFTPASDLDLRAEFDAHELRTSTLLHPELGLNTIIRIAENSRVRAARLGGLLRQLHSLHRAAERNLPEITKQKPFADWTDAIRDLLRAVSWATFTRDTSVEFQTRRKWESALDELATLDFEGTRPTFAEVFGQLEGVLDRTLFAPESRDAPVQIMSPQEAAGSLFDAVFFLRCSDLIWPPSTGTNPLLGWKIQREFGMPGSDPALDIAHASAITHRLAFSAPHIVFSYARQTEDAHQRPSPLLAILNLTPAEILQPSTPVAVVPLEEFPESGYIPLIASKVRGGSSILKNQAACGFRAFAEARLASKPLEAPASGLDASERGSLVHSAMASLWDALQTQSALRALPLAERRAAVDLAITHALDRISDPGHPFDPIWDPAYLGIQRERLHRIIGLWLESELARSPFAIKALEEKYVDLAIGPLTLDVRIDRIDTLLDEEGNPAGKVLLDYKTGDALTRHWQGDRPDDPQLPLYAALSNPGALAGVGFIRLRPGTGMSLAGYASEPGQLLNASVPDIGSLDAQIEAWRRVLTALAEDFAAGDARVRPKQYPNTCAYCAQRILCRVDPELLESATDEDESPVTVAEESYG
ncbi:putative DNA repair protein [Granulicella aggregans]|uniref:Putative DNA repair protein n=1 Tax=Granulicella aggregans TaxID=474949 RepID=A0A7W7Z8T6_9BACT|nr:PD-(D/E)XK nuclease family protein [Granulicella aggregans]MBB5055372.1 putative DNA repair protein [Granulicella aggregans]